ncbi:hypothetical protein DH2020_026259 [Rehmannia glutinosa]|uniref:DUF4378 domain-containing protein n=1 Tax=Rehmannia glutinosa TaxID=99300 RepID=A0ABR0VXI5_REHGL
MAHKQFLHELLKEDQEPFRLKSYIADRRSQLNKPSPATTLQLKKRKPIVQSSNLCKHACFFSFQNSPDVRKSPFFDFPLSPAKSPCKSPNGAVFLHIPSRTAALLVEAAMRIQKQQQQSKPSKVRSKNVGFGLFGSLLKRLKDRSKNKKRAIGGNDSSGRDAITLEKVVEETVRISCSCSNRRLSSADWTENNEDKSLDFEASTSSCGSLFSEGDFGLCETRFCSSPFVFSLHKSPSSSSSGLRTPEFCSPAGSPSRRVNQEKENFKSRNSDNVQGEEEEEDKEQCSPVSILDPPFEDESRDAEDDDYDLECSYENVQRAKQQLLYRLRRFEKLAELDPIELERKLLEGSDDEDQGEREEPEDDDNEQLSLYRKQSVETILTQVFNQPTLQCHSRNMSTDMKKLVSDLIVEEKGEIVRLGNNNEVVMGRICNRLDSWKEVEFNTIDMMIGFDLKRECDGWMKFREQSEEVSAEIELAIYGLLLEELSEELV